MSVEKKALLRYEMILPVINEDYPDVSANQYYERISKTEVLFPNGELKVIRPATLRMWHAKYRKYGFEGLKDKKRQDRGNHRALTEGQKNIIYNIKEKRPKRTALSIYEQLVSEGTIKINDTSLTTVQRYIAKIKPIIGALVQEDMRAFEMEFSNDLWQIDTSHGPFLTVGKQKLKTYIIAIVDDASRMIVGHNIFLADNSINVQKVLKDAILKYGVPKRLYTDNGTPYRNQQLEIICATLGIGLKRAQVYHGNQKGKVERTFKSIKEGWMYNINYNEFTTTEALNDSLEIFTNNKNHVNHASLKETPWDRYLKDKDLIRYHDVEFVNQSFLHTAVRKVGNDATIKLEKKVFEITQGYIGRKIDIKYQPDLSQVFHVDGIEYNQIYEVNKVENSKIKRNQPLLTNLEDHY